MSRATVIAANVGLPHLLKALYYLLIELTSSRTLHETPTIWNQA